MHNELPSFGELCSWFPTLRDHNLSTPAELHRHLKSPACTSGSRAAALFCLSVYDAASGKFQLKDILCWDAEHRAAFERWARDPFFY